MVPLISIEPLVSHATVWIGAVWGLLVVVLDQHGMMAHVVDPPHHQPSAQGMPEVVPRLGYF